MGGWGWDDDPTPPREARLATNSWRLTAHLQALIDRWVAAPDEFRVSDALICDLHAIAMARDTDAGALRVVDVQIGRAVTLFEPPKWQEVPALLMDAYTYVHAALERQRAGEVGHVLHAAAYVLWRLNWIHPFTDGNGRTARAVAYATLCVGFQRLLPGTPTVPELIVMNKFPYWDALKHADAAWARGQLDVSAMEDLLSDLVLRQITGGHPGRG